MLWKWKQEVHIFFNHMQRFHYSICQSNWCQNASKLIYQKGHISFLWDTQNVVYCKFDFDMWRWTGQRQKSNGRENRPTPGRLFSKHPVFHFAPMFHFAPTYYTINSFRPKTNILVEFWANTDGLYSLHVHRECAIWWAIMPWFQGSVICLLIKHRGRIFARIPWKIMSQSCHLWNL